jgi:hypothetical protein
MNIFFTMVIAALLLACAAYAQLRIPRFTAGRSRIVLTRTVLIAVGIGFGYVAAAPYANDRLLAALAFLIGFGAVHFPAAFILFVKRERGAGKS